MILVSPPPTPPTHTRVFCQILNPAASSIMRAAGIPILDPYTAIRTHCGGVPPTSGCKNEPTWGTQCWCPHCPGEGYVWLTNSTLASPLRAMLV